MGASVFLVSGVLAGCGNNGGDEAESTDQAADSESQMGSQKLR